MSQYFNAVRRVVETVFLIATNSDDSPKIQNDLKKDSERLHASFWVPSLYSIIDQSFNLILNFQGTPPDLVHRLHQIYGSIDRRYKSMIGNTYTSYRELRDYISIPSIELFLKQVDCGNPRHHSKGNEDGYTTWRYFLLVGFPPHQHEIPQTSSDMMLEIARAAMVILRLEVILSEKCEAIEPINHKVDRVLFEESRKIGSSSHNQQKIGTLTRNDGESLRKARFQQISNARGLLIKNLVIVRSRLGNPDEKLQSLVPDLDIIKRICRRLIETDRKDFLQNTCQVQNGKRKISDIRMQQIWIPSSPKLDSTGIRKSSLG